MIYPDQENTDTILAAQWLFDVECEVLGDLAEKNPDYIDIYQAFSGCGSGGIVGFGCSSKLRQVGEH